ncbi:8-amino-7-oxononanoate synthase [Flavobacterium sp. SUN046]|uniref:aminotransferase class I/II-fold pyridoxal phosphate-dependent enzyme n=1 Tax=Flavobacterium sp. SUN046 TaxID=3002440 RepID=UPI002DB6CA80|nr:8-amino-7-oxononanoate synthase [Flavobacterium sp. SUN046]MEC4051032.1 8-amino-7-oxononanoate synthase [Flavobacterium sp. SUN046]
MKSFPKALQSKLDQRLSNQSLRSLPLTRKGVDFASNDYLGFAQSELIFNHAHQLLIDANIKVNGATGSRLLSGNHSLYQQAEAVMAQFHQSEAALIFNSGYDANVGFFSSVPQRQDIILFDELCHASIRDGIQMSKAKSYKFIHNDSEDLERLLVKFSGVEGEIYIATESVFSMDGDTPEIENLIALSEQYSARLVVDEAHAVGVFGTQGQGLFQELNQHDKVFARIVTFGKGLGCHGAAVLGSQLLKDYLVNFARSFIYTTGLSPHSVATILVAYQQLVMESTALEQLRHNIQYFNQQKNLLSLKPLFVRSISAIQSAIIPGNEKVKACALALQDKGFDVKPILSPTVPEGQERLRICIHSYNSEAEIATLLELLSGFVF